MFHFQSYGFGQDWWIWGVRALVGSVYQACGHYGVISLATWFMVLLQVTSYIEVYLDCRTISDSCPTFLVSYPQSGGLLDDTRVPHIPDFSTSCVQTKILLVVGACTIDHFVYLKCTSDGLQRTKVNISWVNYSF